MTSFLVISAIEAAIFFGVVILVGRWAHQTQGLVSGYWFAGWLVYSGLTSLITPVAGKHIIDDFLVQVPPSAWTLGQFQAANAYVGLSLSLLAKIAILVLVAAELVHCLAQRGVASDPKVEWLRRIYPSHHRLGFLALVVSTIHPAMMVAIWGSLEMGWLSV